MVVYDWAVSRISVILLMIGTSYRCSVGPDSQRHARSVAVGLARLLTAQSDLKTTSKPMSSSDLTLRRSTNHDGELPCRGHCNARRRDW